MLILAQASTVGSRNVTVHLTPMLMRTLLQRDNALDQLPYNTLAQFYSQAFVIYLRHGLTAELIPVR